MINMKISNGQTINLIDYNPFVNIKVIEGICDVTFFGKQGLHESPLAKKRLRGTFLYNLCPLILLNIL
jgi:hypothetical protein